MRRAVEKLKKDNKASTFVLQLTAMVDMFTIIIVFLLKSYSTSAVIVNPHENLKLPMSTSVKNPVEGIKLIIALDGVFVDDKKIIVLKNGKINGSDLTASDRDFIKPLYEALDKHAKLEKEISDINKEYKFEGKVVMQADERLEYTVIKKVMYTASMAGYADMKLATYSFE